MQKAMILANSLKAPLISNSEVQSQRPPKKQTNKHANTRTSTVFFLPTNFFPLFSFPVFRCLPPFLPP